jgi:hypothetical protein
MPQELSEYQKQYLANRKKIIAQMEADAANIERINYNLKLQYANSLYSAFYLGNGSRQFKRATDKTFVSDAYDWLRMTFK